MTEWTKGLGMIYARGMGLNPSEGNFSMMELDNLVQRKDEDSWSLLNGDSYIRSTCGVKVNCKHWLHALKSANEKFHFRYLYKWLNIMWCLYCHPGTLVLFSFGTTTTNTNTWLCHLNYFAAAGCEGCLYDLRFMSSAIYTELHAQHCMYTASHACWWGQSFTLSVQLWPPIHTIRPTLSEVCNLL